MKPLILGLAASLLAASPAFADVRLTMQDGRVSIVAKDATIRQILTEWARVGQTKIVNAERIPGGPLTLELRDVTETQALSVLLRSMSGYIAAPRAVEARNLSRFDRIVIMPTLAGAPTAVSASSSPSSPPPPVLEQAPQLPEVVEDVQEYQPPAPNHEAVAVPFGAGLAPNGAVPPRGARESFLRSQEIAPQGVLPDGIVPHVPTGQPQTPPGSPTVPFGGLAVPGMIAPASPQPGQPGRRPGGA